MQESRVRLGELLVEGKIITREQLDVALELQASDRRRLGAILIAEGYVSETQVTQVLSQQLSVPWVALSHIDFSAELFQLVPAEIAAKHCLIPIFIRTVRGQGEFLYVAMDDPTDEVAREEVEEFAGIPVRAMIAPPSNIRDAIFEHYGFEGDDIEDESEVLDVDEEPEADAPLASTEAVESQDVGGTERFGAEP